MSKTLEELSVVIGGQIADFKAKMTEAGKSFSTLSKLADSETKALDSRFRLFEATTKDSATSLTGLATKHQYLAEKMKLATVSVDALQKQYDLLKDKPGVTGQALANMSVKLDEAKIKQEKLRQELEKIDSPFKQYNIHLQSVGKNLSELGGNLTRYVSGPIAVLGGSFAALTLKSAESADQLIKMSSQTGLSLGRLQELKYVTGQVGGEFSSLTQASIQLGKNLVAAETSKTVAEAFNTLHVQAQNADGSFRSMDEIFPQVIMKLAAMPNEIERNNIAVRLFGKGGAELIPILDAGSAEIQKLSERAREMGLVLADDTVKRLDDAGDKIDEFKLRLSAMGSELVDTFLKLPEGVQLAIVALFGLGVAVGPVVSGIGGLTTAYAAMQLHMATAGMTATTTAAATTAAGAAAGGATPLVTGLGTAFTGMLGPIGVIVGALSLFGIWAKHATDKAREAGKEIEGMADQWTYFRDQVEQDISLPPGISEEEKETLMNLYGGGTTAVHKVVAPEVGTAETVVPTGGDEPTNFGTKKTLLDIVREKLSAISTEIGIVKAKYDLFIGGLSPTGGKIVSLNAQLEQQQDELALAGDKVTVLEDAVAKMTAIEGAASENTRNLTLDLLKAQKAYQDVAKSIADTNVQLEKQELIKKGLTWRAEGRLGTKAEISDWAAQTYVQHQLDTGQEIDSTKLDKLYSRSVIGMAMGGLITEPIYGIGLSSGNPYTFGETGPEKVSPLGQTSGIDYERLGDVIASRLLSALRRAPIEVNVSTGSNLRAARLALGV